MAVDITNFPTNEAFYFQVDKKNLAFENKIKGFFFDSQIMINTGVYVLKDAFILFFILKSFLKNTRYLLNT